jgi:hypothetical protein
LSPKQPRGKAKGCFRRSIGTPHQLKPQATNVELDASTNSSKNVKFDPACDGFEFSNSIDRAPDKTGGGRILSRFDAFVYGKGLCFGMAAAVLLTFSGEAKGLRPPLTELSLTSDLLAVLREYQIRQFRPRMILATVRD